MKTAFSTVHMSLLAAVLALGATGTVNAKTPADQLMWA